jgi:hypothetical protein
MQLEREKAERKRKLEVEIDFAPEVRKFNIYLSWEKTDEIL